ncbi:hypothetical protein PMAYCL1PPCAC_19059, partial [Pristionchus mayeri]
SQHHQCCSFQYLPFASTSSTISTGRDEVFLQDPNHGRFSEIYLVSSRKLPDTKLSKIGSQNLGL